MVSVDVKHHVYLLTLTCVTQSAACGTFCSVGGHRAVAVGLKGRRGLSATERTTFRSDNVSMFAASPRSVYLRNLNPV